MRQLFLLLTVVLFIGCELTDTEKADICFNRELQGIDLYHGDYSEINEIIDINNYIAENFEYKETKSYQAPIETESIKELDCKAAAILYLNILYVRFGIIGNIIVFDKTRAVVSGGYVDHFLVEVNGIIIEPRYCLTPELGTFDELEDSIGYIYYGSDIFNL